MSAVGTVDLMKTLTEVMSPYLVKAVTFCALPHWFTQSTGLAIIKTFVDEVGTDEDAEQVFAELLDLPFVYAHGDNAWQYTEATRAYFCQQLSQHKVDVERVSKFLVVHLQEQLDMLGEDAKRLQFTPLTKNSEIDWEIRRIQWQLAYHWAPLDAAEAMRRLINISEWAGSNERYLGDHRLVVNVWHEQKDWLREYQAEGAYLEGCYAYAQRDYSEAEEKLTYVWVHQAHNPLITAKAGHRLAVILRQKGQRVWLEKAEVILRRSLAICEKEIDLSDKDVKVLASYILNSLGATLVQLRDLERIQEAEIFLQRSLRLNKETRNFIGEAHVLNSLGTLWVNLGRLAEAEGALRQALEIARQFNDDRTKSMTENSLAHVLIHQHCYAEAEPLLRDSLDYGKKQNDYHHVAQVHKRRGILYKEWGGKGNLLKAKKFFKLSLRSFDESGKNEQGRTEVRENLESVERQLGKYVKKVKKRTRLLPSRHAEKSQSKPEVYGQVKRKAGLLPTRHRKFSKFLATREGYPKRLRTNDEVITIEGNRTLKRSKGVMLPRQLK